MTFATETHQIIFVERQLRMFFDFLHMVHCVRRYHLALCPAELALMMLLFQDLTTQMLPCCRVVERMDVIVCDELWYPFGQFCGCVFLVRFGHMLSSFNGKSTSQ